MKIVKSRVTHCLERTGSNFFKRQHRMEPAQKTRRAICPSGTSERQVTARPEKGSSPNSQTTRAGVASSQLIHRYHLSDPPRARGTGLRLWANVGLPKDQIEARSTWGQVLTLQTGATSIQKIEACPYVSSLQFFGWCRWVLAIRCSTHARATAWSCVQQRNALEHN